MSITRTPSLSLVLLALLAAPAVSAQEEESPGAPAEEPEPEPEPEPGAPDPALAQPRAVKAEKAEKAEKAQKAKVKAGGRVFVRETFSQDGPAAWTAQTSLASARLGVGYQVKHLRARVEVELRKTAKLRNAYLDVQATGALGVRAGLFKMPVSPLELTSSWVLPIADRGLVSNILRNRLEIAGRRVGAVVTWTPGAQAAEKTEERAWRPRLRAGYFQGVDDVGELLDATVTDAYGKVGVARVELGPLGASGSVRQGQPVLLGPIRTAWATTVDATGAWHGLRFWLEATVGSSWLVAEPTRQSALFFETRGLAGWRVGGAKAGAAYLEPYVLVGLIDPDRQLAEDLVLEVTTGVNVGSWKRWRLQAELEVWRFGRNVPAAFTNPGSAAVDRTAAVLQLGAAF